MFFRVADIVFHIVSSLKLPVEATIRDFLVPQTTPDITIEIEWGDLSQKPEGRKVFDSGDIWQLYQSGGEYLFSFSSPLLGSVPYKLARINKDVTTGKILLHEPYFDHNQPVNPLEYPLDELLLINFLALGKGLEIHSCGIIDQLGQGRLFVGQSGAGKTTIARLLQQTEGITVLSDDRMILRQMGQTLWRYGTPWHGEAGLASPARAPLSQVYFLEKGSKNELAPQKRADAVGRLFACSFLPFYSHEGLAFTLSFLEEVVKATPCHVLKWLPDRKVIEFLEGRR
jgi:hypothetical protein